MFGILDDCQWSIEIVRIFLAELIYKFDLYFKALIMGAHVSLIYILDDCQWSDLYMFQPKWSVSEASDRCGTQTHVPRYPHVH